MTDKILPTHVAKRIRKLLIQVGNFEVLCAQQEDELERLRKDGDQNYNLHSNVVYLTARIETLEEENTKLAEQIKDHEENESAATQTILNLDNDLTAKDAQIERMLTVLDEREDILKDLRDDHQYLTGRNKYLEEQNDELLAKLSIAQQNTEALHKIIKAQGDVHREGILKMVIFLSKNDLQFSGEISTFLGEGQTIQAIKHLRAEIQRCYDFDPGLKVCFDAIHAHPSYRPNPAFFGEIPASYFEDPPDED